MITYFIVLATGIVIRCVGMSCDATSTALFTAATVEGTAELIFVIAKVIKVFAVKEKKSKKDK